MRSYMPQKQPPANTQFQFGSRKYSFRRKSSLSEDYPSAFRNERALMQKRNPLGAGPSGNTWPR